MGKITLRLTMRNPIHCHTRWPTSTHYLNHAMRYSPVFADVPWLAKRLIRRHHRRHHHQLRKRNRHPKFTHMATPA